MHARTLLPLHGDPAACCICLLHVVTGAFIFISDFFVLVFFFLRE